MSRLPPGWDREPEMTFGEFLLALAFALTVSWVFLG